MSLLWDTRLKWVNIRICQTGKIMSTETKPSPEITTFWRFTFTKSNNRITATEKMRIDKINAFLVSFFHTILNSTADQHALYRLHIPINFSIGYNAKNSKVSHLLQFDGHKSDPGFGGMWQPFESAIDPGIFMSSSSLRKHMTLPAIWHPQKFLLFGSQTGMTDRLFVALHPAK